MIAAPRPALSVGGGSDRRALTPTARRAAPASTSTSASIAAWESTRSMNATPAIRPAMHATVVPSTKPAANPTPSIRGRSPLMTTSVAASVSGLAAARTPNGATWSAAFTVAAAASVSDTTGSSEHVGRFEKSRSRANQGRVLTALAMIDVRITMEIVALERHRRLRPRLRRNGVDRLKALLGNSRCSARGSGRGPAYRANRLVGASVVSQSSHVGDADGEGL